MIKIHYKNGAAVKTIYRKISGIFGRFIRLS